jgi:uncharacterized RDD family membrane protein YckC
VSVVFAGTGARLIAYVIDVILLLTVGLVIVGLLGPVGDLAVRGTISAVLNVILDAAYFIGLWMSPGKATVGQRILRLQVGNAFDGQRLRLDQAVRRWIALGSWLALLGLVATLATFQGTVSLIWAVVLLATTAMSPTRQGLHDRFAGSAVVAPVAASSLGMILGCLLIVGLIILALIVGLIFLGSQLPAILSEVGTSVVAP